MAKQNNFKIFEFENQLLARKSYDEEEFKIVFTIIKGGLELSLTVGYDDEDTFDEMFEKDNFEQAAKSMHDAMVEMFKDMEED